MGLDGREEEREKEGRGKKGKDEDEAWRGKGMVAGVVRDLGEKKGWRDSRRLGWILLVSFKVKST